MRTLSEITAAVRQGDPVTGDELRYAVVAYDVMVAQMELPNNPDQLRHYFQAADNDPREYAGEANDPALPDARQWYAAMHNAGAPEKSSAVGVKTCGVCDGVGVYDAGLDTTRECKACRGTGVLAV